MIEDLLLPFIAVGIAELGDKTQLAIFCLSSKTKSYLRLLLGVIIAFVVADGLAILLGNYITNIIPMIYIQIISGAVFILFGIMTLANSKEEDIKCELANPFFSAFSLIFLSELGDKTQITSGLFATKFNPLLVFVGVILALAILSIIAIYLGQTVLKKFDKKLISRVAGALFILIGVFCLFNNL